MRYKDAVVDLSQKVEAGVTDLQTALRYKLFLTSGIFFVSIILQK